MITQIFFVGSSSVYGVGGPQGGWADIVKQKLHKQMYGQNGAGQVYEIYNFGKSGATVDFVQANFPVFFKQYNRGAKTITILNVGGNNAKAKGTPDNFVSTPEEYKKEMHMLLTSISTLSTHTIGVGYKYFDETKTYPIYHKEIGGNSYFSNARTQEFNAIFKTLCTQKGLPFVDIDVEKDTWIREYLYEDGLHPNQKGHELIATKVLSELERIM